MRQQSNRYWTRTVMLSLVGLAAGIAGIVLQWVGDPALFPGGFPPGILFLLGAGILVWLTRRWFWAPLFSILMAAWVTFGGLVGGQLGTNLASGSRLVVSGALVLQVGLALAIVSGVVAVVQNLARSRQRR